MATNKKLTGQHRYTEFGIEAIANRVKKMLDYRDKIDVESEHVRISYDNRKTTALVPSVSLIPVHDCGNCALCARGCYDVRNVCYLPSVQRNRAINSAIYKENQVRYFKEIEAACRRLRFFRWHVGGDIKDYAYLINMVRVAQNVPECQFLVFTKMYDIVNDYLDLNQEFPSNFHLILSGWKGDTHVNRHNLPVSSPVFADGQQSCMVTKNVFMCPGNCADCAEINGGCWGAGKGDTILFEAH